LCKLNDRAHGLSRTTRESKGASKFQWPKRFAPFMVNGALKIECPKTSK
jgi:hypothetical protein